MKWLLILINGRSTVGRILIILLGSVNLIIMNTPQRQSAINNRSRDDERSVKPEQSPAPLDTGLQLFPGADYGITCYVDIYLVAYLHSNSAGDFSSPTRTMLHIDQSTPRSEFHHFANSVLTPLPRNGTGDSPFVGFGYVGSSGYAYVILCVTLYASF